MTHTTASGHVLTIKGNTIQVTRNGEYVASVLLRATKPIPQRDRARLRASGRNPDDYRMIGSLIMFHVDADWIDARVQEYVPRDDPKDLRAEPGYPGIETVLMTMRDPTLTMHPATNRCTIEYPHKIADCGEWL